MIPPLSPLILYPEDDLNNGYLVSNILGTGASAIVVQAKTPRKMHDVAVKICKEQCLICEKSLSEWEILKLFQGSPHVLQAKRAITLSCQYSIDADGTICPKKEGIHGHIHAIVTELLSPNAYKTLVEPKARLSVDTTIRIGMQGFEALLKFQEKNIVHRDIKPDNITWEKGFLTIFDLDTAKDLNQIDPKFPVGTPAYWSPEQAFLLPYGAGVDVWGLAATLFELYTGTRFIAIGIPVEKDNLGQIIIDYFCSLTQNFGALPASLPIPQDYQCLFKADRSMNCSASPEAQIALDDFRAISREYPTLPTWRARLLHAAHVKGESDAEAQKLISFLKEMFQVEKKRITPIDALSKFKELTSPRSCRSPTVLERLTATATPRG